MILAIDPGTAITGVSVVSGTKKDPVIHFVGVIRTQAHTPDVERLVEIQHDIEEIITTYKPNLVMIEELFFFKNQKTIITVAQARGVVLATCGKYNLDIQSLTPLQVKLALCGYGRATKKQIQEAVTRLYKLDKPPQPDDAADSLALGWCALS